MKWRQHSLQMHGELPKLRQTQGSTNVNIGLAGRLKINRMQNTKEMNDKAISFY